MILRFLGGASRTSSSAVSAQDAAAVDAAIARVLAAEAAASDDVRAAAQEAEALAENARRRAREIGERAERRIRGARGRYEASIAQRVACIEAETASVAVEHALTTEERERAGRAADVVAAELIGARR